jgi:hypothetical protein
MIERHIHAVAIEDPGQEEPARTRERLRDIFPAGSTRRMTQLGLVLGSVLHPIALQEEDAIVYASAFAETGALEAYLGSFPTASPMLFQTSIHPSAVQQVLIARERPVRQFYPLTGRLQLAAHAVQTALLAPAARSILCGGEERKLRLLDHGAGSPETFAFALALTAEPSGALGTLGLEASDAPEGSLCLPDFFSALRDRRPLREAAAPGLTLILSWT